MKIAKFGRRALLLILAALCALLPLAARAEIAVSAREDDGVVRVCLRSLGAPEELTVTADGVYTVERDANFRFARGTKFRLCNIGGSVWLDAGGMALNMGPTLTLTRQAAGDEAENGLRVAEAARGNLYPGDLCVSAEGDALRAVLYIQMEDYLCGVVSCEMSDDWPLEALKAQAVAARTYALRAKANSGKRDYDVVDTTADQAFAGCDARLANVEEAVRATEGIVGVYNGELAACFYTASNGGETALPGDVWSGGGDYGYLERKADPYDLENRKSMVSAATFKKDASDLPALREMLEEALARQPGAEEAKLISIQAVAPAEPVAEGSAVCGKLKFTLQADVPVPVPEPSEEDADAPAEATASPSGDPARDGQDYLRRIRFDSPFESFGEVEIQRKVFDVELDVYDQIKDGLGLGLNESDREVVRVRELPGAYSIELRRYGHGVGMSQRGAQTMAGAHGMGFEEILAFYYPGMELERIEWDSPELVALDDLPGGSGLARPLPSPTPEPAPLPEPRAGEYAARVTLDDASSSLNLRESPSTDAPVVALLYHNDRVLAGGEADAGGWVHVRTAEAEGYAKLEYLTRE